MTLGQGSRKIRDQIGDVAMRLFAERGYQQVSLADIALAAGLPLDEVTRQVHNKESLILGASAHSPLWILDQFQAAPKGADSRLTLQKILVERISMFPEDKLRMWRAAAREIPQDLHDLTRLGVIERASLVAMVAERMGVDQKSDPRPSALVSSVIGAVGQAYEIWLHQKSEKPLLELIEGEFASLDH